MHDTSVTGVVLPNISLPNGTVQKIVATISAGGSVGQHNMGRLLSLVDGADYETGKQQDAVEFLKKMTAFDIGVTDSWTETASEINTAVILEMHVNGLSRFLRGDISGPEFLICNQYTGTPACVILALDYNVVAGRNVVQSAPHLDLAPLQHITLKGTHYQLVTVAFYQGNGKKGHYVSFRKRGSTWYELNDDHSVEVTIDELLNNQSRAQVLVYRQNLDQVPLHTNSQVVPPHSGHLYALVCVALLT